MEPVIIHTIYDAFPSETTEELFVTVKDHRTALAQCWREAARIAHHYECYTLGSNCCNCSFELNKKFEAYAAEAERQ